MVHIEVHPRFPLSIDTHIVLDGKVIGVISQGTLLSGVCKLIGWKLITQYRGKGYGTTAIKMYLQQYPEFYLAEINHKNIASRRLAEKCGFELLCDQGYLKYLYTPSLTINFVDKDEILKGRGFRVPPDRVKGNAP